eukprot:CAMPEP_0185843900 /NCGR_PEP_ID=MMETSP1354-20130828/262_1 /TAXON_ID=708628 /ORGANISM="Erythrolobus madagascarensis, Strain CCMP3276" /LENGTH=973 /DNA_ID=CAMNT_0028543483 /DNA_START=59 /DNA_END=2980 /DNA_ORIENTATION=-
MGAIRRTDSALFGAAGVIVLLLTLGGLLIFSRESHEIRDLRGEARGCIRTDSWCSCSSEQKWELEELQPQVPTSIEKTCTLGKKTDVFRCDCRGSAICEVANSSTTEKLVPTGQWTASGTVSCEFDRSPSTFVVLRPLSGQLESSEQWEPGRINFDIRGSFHMGEKVRRISVPRIFSKDSTAKELEAVRGSFLPHVCTQCFPPAPRGCELWIVAQVASAKEARGVMKTVKHRIKWCVVFVMDMDHGSKWSIGMTAKNAVILGRAEQKSLRSEILQYLPRDHTALKMIGYLYAIRQNPVAIFDASAAYSIQDAEFLAAALKESTEIPVKMKQRISLSFNPLPESHPVRHRAPKGSDMPKSPSKDSFSWPRGLALSAVADFRATGMIDSGFSVKSSQIGVLHSLVEGAPDTDSVFSLTQSSAPVRFNREEWLDSLHDASNIRFDFGRWTRAMPKGVFVPYSAHSSLHTSNSLWALWLPSSRPARVADVWRSYVMQRLMWDEGLHAAVTEPFVRADEGPPDGAHTRALSTFEHELDFQRKIDSLLRVLSEIELSGEHTAARLEQLVIELYEHGFLDLQDVLLAQAWIRDLLTVGYRFNQIQRDTLYHALPETVPEYLPSYSAVRKSFADAQGGPQKKGRVAVCMSGQFRGFSYVSNAIDERYPLQTQQIGEVASVPIRRHPSDSLRQFLFPALEPHGFDVFMHVLTSEKYVWEPLMSDTNACGAIIPKSSDKYKLFCNLELESRNGFSVPASPRWSNKTHWTQRGVKGLVAQLHGIYRCNEMRKERERTTGARYDYMIRFRVDSYMMSMMPSIGNFQFDNIIAMNNQRACCCGNRDNFGLGYTEHMQHYLDRVALLSLSDIHADGEAWIAEDFAEHVALDLDDSSITDSPIRYCYMPRHDAHGATNYRWLRSNPRARDRWRKLGYNLSWSPDDEKPIPVIGANELNALANMDIPTERFPKSTDHDATGLHDETLIR